MHPPRDSNSHQRFWRPACYHYTRRMFVGMTGFEPVTLRVSDECSNQLSYIPICDSAAARTQDSYIKSVVLYQLSYEIYLRFLLDLNQGPFD
jgi:hypothetical protein